MKSSINNTFIFFFILFTCLVFKAFSQQCIWSSTAGGTDFDCGRFIATDKNGNTYVAGNTSSNSCYFVTDTIHDDPFLVKYSSSGSEEWVFELKTGPGTNWQDKPGLLCVVFDTLREELLLTGSFYNYLALSDTTVSKPGANIFILKLNTDGNRLWIRIAGGNGIDWGTGITYDENGNFYVSGVNSSEAAFDQITIPRGGFLAKYNANGNVIWAKNKFRYSPYSSSFTEASPSSLLYSNNNLFVNGTLSNDTIIIDTVTLINQVDFVSSYIASFSTEGNLKWINTAGGPEANPGYQIGIDHSMNLYITGIFYGKGVFGNDTLTNTSGSGDCFLAKYHPNGQLQWVTQTNTSQSTWGRSVAAFSDEGVYLGGHFSGTIHPGDTAITSISNSDMFLVHYSLNGHFVGITHYGHGDIVSIATDEHGNVCFTGEFEDTLSIGSNTFYSRGGDDFFAAKCSPIIGGIESPHFQSDQLLIYANPTNGICNITIPENLQHETDLTLFIYDGTGKLIQKIPVHFDQDKITINIKAEAKGIYNAVLTNGKKNYSGKIVFD